VAGGSGSIGSELVRQLAPNSSVWIFDIDETRTFDLYEELRQKGYKVDYRIGNIRDRQAVWDAFSDFKPDYVFNCAALKHVSPAEKYPEEYVQTNILGNLNLLDFAGRYSVKKYVFISTDKVVNAKCVMGITKLAAEVMTRNAGRIAVRFGNVLRSRGSVLEIWERQIGKGEPITVTNPDMERYYMTIPQACELVLEAAENSEDGDLLVMDMGGRKKVIDIAHEFLTHRGIPDYPIKFIGVRPGETLVEKLMTDEEEKFAVKSGKFWVIKK
jgi:FlaA1/EpsC-like NDP-sugar epimerase